MSTIMLCALRWNNPQAYLPELAHKIIPEEHNIANLFFDNQFEQEGRREILI